MTGQLFGQLRDPLRDLCQPLGARDELLLRAASRPDQLGEMRHQIRNLLGRGNDLVIPMVPLEVIIKRVQIIQSSMILEYLGVLPVGLPGKARGQPGGWVCLPRAPS